MDCKRFSSLYFLGIKYGIIHFEIQKEIVVGAQMRSGQEGHSMQKTILIDPSSKKNACVLGCQEKHQSHLIMEEKCASTYVLRINLLPWKI